jgi:hypothetical protein
VAVSAREEGDNNLPKKSAVLWNRILSTHFGSAALDGETFVCECCTHLFEDIFKRRLCDGAGRGGEGFLQRNEGMITQERSLW